MSEPFCYWDIKNLPDAIIGVVQLGVVLCIFTITVLRVRSITKYKQHKKILRIYLLIAFWAFLIASQLCFGVFVYFLVIMKAQDLTTINMNSYSRNYTRLDIIPGFVVQTLFLEICKLYYKGLLNSIEISHLAKWQIKLIKFLKGYCVIRILNQCVGILLVNVFSDNQLLPFLMQINLVILVVDSAIINFLLIVSLRIFVTRFSQSGRVYESDLKELKKEYTIMIITSLLRIIIDVIFAVLPIGTTDQQCIGWVDGHLMRTIVYNCVANIVNHILPIVWFLKIYSFQSLEDKYPSHTTQDSGNQLVRSIID